MIVINPNSDVVSLKTNQIPDAWNPMVVQADEVGDNYRSRIRDLVKIVGPVKTLVKLAEDVAILFYSIKRARTTADVVVACGTFVKLQLKDEPLLFNDRIKSLLSYFEIDMQVQGSMSDTLKFTRISVDKIQSYMKSEMTHRIRSLILAAITIGLVDRTNIHPRCLPGTIEQLDKAQSRDPLSPDFLFQVFETLLFVVERIHTVAITGNISTFFHGADSYQQWVTECNEIDRMSKLLNEPSIHGFSEPEFMKRLEDAIEKGREIGTLLRKSDAAAHVSAAKLNMRLLTLRDVLITKEFAAKFREAPFPLLMNGKSCIGKSTLIWIIFYLLGKVLKLPTDKRHAYFKNGFAEFWDAFKTYMWFVVIDDVAFMNASMAQSSGGDPSVMEIIQINNNANYTPNQAALEDKGKIPLRNKVTIATTNTKHLNAQHFFQYPSAVQRRFPYIVNVAVKPEYAKHGMLDGSKMPQGEVPDIWLFEIEELDGFNGSTDTLAWKKTHSFSRIDDFLQWVARKAVAWMEQQQRCNDQVELFAQMEFCETCYSRVCSCSPRCEVCGYTECRCSDEESSFSISADEGSEVATEDLSASLRSDLSGLAMQADVETPEARMIREIVERVQEMRQQGNEPRTCAECGSVYLGDQCGCEASDLDFCVYCMHAECVCETWAGKWICVKEKAQQTYELGRAYLKVFGHETLLYVADRSQCLKHRLMEALATTVYVWLCRFLMHTYFFTRWLSPGVGQFFFDWCIVQIAPLVLAWPDFWHKLGAAMERKIGVPMWIPTAISAFALVVGGMKVWKHIADLTVQGNTFSAMRPPVDVGQRPVVAEGDDAKKNVWYKDDFILCKNDVGAGTMSNKSVSSKELAERIANHVVRVTSYIEKEDITTYTRATGLMIGGQVLLMNNHCFKDNSVMEIRFGPEKDQVSPNFIYRPSASDVERHPETDTVYILLRPVRHFSSIIHYFAEASYRGSYPGTMAKRTNEGIATIQAFKKTTGANMNLLSDFTGRVLMAVVAVPTGVGDCGSVYIHDSPLGPVILGLHVAGGEQHVACTVVPAEQARKAMMHFDPLQLQRGQCYVKGKIGPLHPKSPFRYIESGRAHVLGSLETRQTFKGSRFAQTILAGPLKKRGFVLRHGAPEMNHWMTKQIALQGVLSPQTTGVDNDVLDAVTESFTSEILSGLTPEDFSKIHMVDMNTALAGAEGVPHIDRIKLSTSAGHPYGQPKRNLVRERDTEPRIELNDEVFARVATALQECERGEIPDFVFECALKDEPTSFAKIEAKKTRVFSMSSFESTIIGRMCTLGLGRVIPDRFEVFETVIGMNCGSAHWGRAQQWLTSKTGLRKRKMAGDYAMYDKTTPTVFILAAIKVLLGIFKGAGWSERDLRIAAAWMHSLPFAFTNFFGDVVVFPKGNPSGCAITTLLNSIANSLLFRYAFCKTWTGNKDVALGLVSPKQMWLKVAREFRIHVALLTLGDDNCADVREGCGLNHVSMAAILNEFGMTYTMAEKTAKLVPFIGMEEVTFLKRRWVYDERIQDFAAPLEWASIEKMLMCCVKTNAYEEKTHAEEVIDAALRYAWDHGDEKFHHLKEVLLEVAEEAGITPLTRELPTAGQLLRQWVDNSRVELARQGRQPPPCQDEVPSVTLDITWELQDGAPCVVTDDTEAMTNAEQAMIEMLQNMSNESSTDSDSSSSSLEEDSDDDVNVQYVFFSYMEGVGRDWENYFETSNHVPLHHFTVIQQAFGRARCICENCFTINGFPLLSWLDSRCETCRRIVSEGRMCWVPGHFGEAWHTTWAAVTAIDTEFVEWIENGLPLQQRAGDPSGPF